MNNKDLNIIKLQEAIKNNKPIFIKNFLSNYQKDLSYVITDINNTENADKHYYSSGVYAKNLDSHNFIINIKSDLNNQNDLIYTPKTRYWIHPKGNITMPHYDGDGTNVINICLQGKKKFILSSPNSHINFPFSNLSILDIADNKQEFILESGDLLLIPSFWYHEVHCMEDSTITINIIFVDSQLNTPYPQKVKYFFHKLLNTTMSNKSKAVDLSIKDINFSDFVFDYFFELISLILVFVFFEYIGKKLGIYLNEIILTGLLLFALQTFYKYNGISIVTAFNYLIIFVVYRFFIKN